MYQPITKNPIGTFMVASLCMASLLLSETALAQNGERSFFYDNFDLKHYALTEVEGQDEYFTAGTVFQYRDFSSPFASDAVHCIYADKMGTPFFNVVLDDPNYDERAVGAHIFNSQPLVVYGRTGMNDCGIEVTALDAAGIVLSSKTITGTVPGFEDLYPMGTLKFNDAELFICGFAVARGTVPRMATPKASFVIRFNVNANSVMDMALYKSSTNIANDYDMAVRMKRTRDEKLWVGGSVNDGPLMNMVVDPWNLSSFTQNHFGDFLMDANNYYQYSFDLKETDNGDKFVFSNTYMADQYPIQPLMTPRFFNISALDAFFSPYSVNSRLQFSGFDYAWGTNIIEDADDYTVTLAGFATNRTCNRDPKTNNDNINPFLTRLKLEYSSFSGISVTPLFWNTLLSYNGTGKETLSNSYYQQGSFPSDKMWGVHSFVHDKASTEDLVLTCPVWNNSGKLNIKFIRTDKDGRLDNCVWEPACDVKFDPVYMVRSGGVGLIGASYIEDLHIPVRTIFNPNFMDDCSGHYRTTAAAGVAAVTGELTAVPNPAASRVTIKWTADAGQNITLQITDMTGRVMLSQELSQVKGANTAELDIRNLAPGVYHYGLSGTAGRSKGMFVKQ